MKEKILVVDDDRRLRDLLVRYLGEQGYTACPAADGAEMDRQLAQDSFDLLVLDLMLPGEDGLAICRRLRGAGDGNLAIIMLTAKGDEVDRIIGLEMGADDYLPKPFNPRELLARINAVLRRRKGAPAGVSAPDDSIVFGDYRLDPRARCLTRQGESVPLTSGEFSLLHVLAEHPNQPLSRDMLMDKTRGRGMEAFDRSIDVQISRLRKIIEPDPAHPSFIRTVWGFGYVFVP